jgi:predicted enzyme related to lactoylglutathione lyase
VSASLAAITFDCADAEKLASFWSAVLDRPIADDPSPESAYLQGAPMWGFIRVPEPKTAKNRMHVDLGTADLAAEVDRIIGLGAKRVADVEEGGFRWTTLADPEGNEFCVVQE